MNINRIRTILNILFMIGALAAVILYFSPDVDRVVFFYVCCVALFLKMVEYVLRFLLR